MKISTHTIRHLSQAVALALVAAGIAIPVGAAAVKHSSAAPTGEAKNGTPFTQLVTAPASLPTGEAKNQLPFTAPAEVQPQTIVLRTSSGFSWGDAAIGAFGALGIAFALTGIAMYARTTRPQHSSPAH